MIEPKQSTYLNQVKVIEEETGLPIKAEFTEFKHIIKRFNESRFSVSYSNYTIQTRSDTKFDDKLQFIKVKLHFSSSKTSEPPADVISNLEKLTDIAMDYWKEYSSINNLNGVVFINSTNDYKLTIFENNELPYFHIRDTKEMVDKKVIQFLCSYYYSLKEDVIAAEITKEKEQDLLKLIKPLSIIEQALKDNPLFTPTERPLVLISEESNSRHIFDMLSVTNNIDVTYGGVPVYIKLNKDYETILFYNLYKNPDLDTINVTVPINECQKGFDQVSSIIKEEQKLKHLARPPKKQFIAFFRKHKSVLSSYEKYLHEFDKLVTLFGGWEPVELEFAELNKRGRVNTIIDSYDSARRLKIRVFECLSKEYKYFFVECKQETNDLEEEVYSIIPSNNLVGTEDLQNELSKLIFKGLQV